MVRRERGEKLENIVNLIDSLVLTPNITEIKYIKNLWNLVHKIYLIPGEEITEQNSFFLIIKK